MMPRAADLQLLWPLLGGLGICLTFYALATAGRRVRRAAPLAARDRVAGVPWGLPLAATFVGESPRPARAERIRQALRQANWFWAAGEPAPPDPAAPFHTVRGYALACTWRALVYGVLALVGGAALALALAAPLWVAPILAGLAAYLGYSEPAQQLARAVAVRHHRLTVEMAFRLPELAAVVSTGVSTIHALRTLTARPGGPFTTELARLLRVYDTTTSLEAAVEAVIRHNRFTPLSEFLQQVLQVELRGGSLGPVMLTQAELAQQTLQRRLLEQGVKNAGTMQLPVVAGSALTLLMLVSGPALWMIVTYL